MASFLQTHKPSFEKMKEMHDALVLAVGQNHISEVGLLLNRGIVSAKAVKIVSVIIKRLTRINAIANSEEIKKQIDRHQTSLQMLQESLKDAQKAFFDDVRSKNYEGVARALELGLVDVNMRENDQRAALHIAADRGDTKMVLELLARGADVTAREGLATALHCAGRNGHKDTVFELLVHGIVNERYTYQYTIPLYIMNMLSPLQRAIIRNNANDARKELLPLLKRPMDNLRELNDAFRLAARTGRYDMVDLLIDYGVYAPDAMDRIQEIIATFERNNASSIEWMHYDITRNRMRAHEDAIRSTNTTAATPLRPPGARVLVTTRAAISQSPH
jgi:ankyrin repeat protein